MIGTGTSGCDNFPVPIISGYGHFRFRSFFCSDHFRFRSVLVSDHFRFRSFPVTFISDTVISGSDQFRFRSVPVPIISLVTVISGFDHFRFRSSSGSDPFLFRSLHGSDHFGFDHFRLRSFRALWIMETDLSIHLSVNLEFSNTTDKSYLNISKLQ